MQTIILGSQSEGRRKVLERHGIQFKIQKAGIDEKAIRSDDPVELTEKIALAKAEALLPVVEETALLITADTVVFCNGRILEKPEDEREAFSFFALYESCTPELISAAVVVNTETGKRKIAVDRAAVLFAPIPRDTVAEYIGTGDAFLRAGGFAIQHPLIEPYVKEIKGDSDTVYGLPFAFVEKAIRELS